MDKYNIKAIDCHMHVVKQISGFGARGELRSIGGGKASYPNGDVIQVFSDGKDHLLYTDLLAIMDENKIEKGILLQGP